MNSEPVDVKSFGSHSIAFKTVVNILTKWGCDHRSMSAILGMTINEFQKNTKSPESIALDEIQIYRCSHILRIHSALRVLFDNPDNFYGFMSMENNHSFFGGRCPVDRLAGGEYEELIAVSSFIDRLIYK